MKTTTVDAMSELWRDGGMLSLDAAPFGERADEGLASLFEIGRRAVHNLRRHCEHNSPDGRACFVGQLPGWIEGAKLRAFMHGVELRHPIRPETPFEGTERIAGRRMACVAGPGRGRRRRHRQALLRAEHGESTASHA